MPYYKKHDYATYILTNKANTVFYIGMTSDLSGRVWQHKNKAFDGFTSKYNVNKLVYYEDYQWVHDRNCEREAIKRWFTAKENRFDRIYKSGLVGFERGVV